MFVFDAKLKMNDCDLGVDKDLGFGLNHHDRSKDISFGVSQRGI